MTSLKPLAVLFKKKFPQVCELALDLNLTLVLVGGVTRDFLLLGHLSEDIDIEVHRQDDQSYFQFKDELNKIGVASINQLNIITYTANEGSLEFTPPRIEIYNGAMGHSNFKPEFMNTTPFQNSFKRRDITINAIGFNPINKELIDPFSGVKDIESKTIRPVSDDFSKDPVRFIRAVRFKTNFGFDYSTSIKTMMDTEGLKGLNAHHFFLEYAKAKNKMDFLKDIKRNFKKSFLKDFIFLPSSEIDELSHLKLWWYLKNENKDYLAWIGASVKNYQRALNVYKNKGEGIEKLPLREQDFLSRII